MNRLFLKIISFIFAALTVTVTVSDLAVASEVREVSLSDLPREAKFTLDLIKQGGPFAFEKDGVVFGNYEGRLPKHKRGYYHEYTVKTPYARNRGARRIITGGERQQSLEFFYTDDHYQSFSRIRE